MTINGHTLAPHVERRRKPTTWIAPNAADLIARALRCSAVDELDRKLARLRDEHNLERAADPWAAVAGGLRSGS